MTVVTTAEKHPGATVGGAAGAATGAVVRAAIGKSGTSAVIGGLLVIQTTRMPLPIEALSLIASP